MQELGKPATEKEADEVSNSPLATYTRISPNRSSPRKHKLDTITIHCIVGQWTAKQGVDYFYNDKIDAAPNYVVGKDGSIGLCVPEADRSWCTGGDRSVLGKTGRDNDHRAITIETASDTTDPYAVASAAYDALVDLCTDICKRNGKKRLLWFADAVKTIQYEPQDDEMVMTVHRWFANKCCPGDYLYSRHAAIAVEVNKRLQKEDKHVETDNAWSREAREWAVKIGLVQGGTPNPDGTPNYGWDTKLTREQFVVVLHRFAKLMGKV